MAEEAKDRNESQQENKSEKVDNRLPYEPPTLRKHGKINNTTKLTFIDPFNFDGFFDFSDFS